MEGTFAFLGLTVYPFGLFVTMAALVMLVLMGVLGMKCRLPEGTVRVFGVIAVPMGVLFARLVYCLMNLPFFIGTYENPGLMLRFFDGGFSMTGLLLGLVLAVLIAAKIMKAPLSDLFDVFAVGLAAFLALVYFGHQYTELGVGKVVEANWLTENLPFLFIARRMGRVEYRLAVYLYQAIFCLILLCVSLCLFLGKKQRRSGNVALSFFTILGAGEILLESLRDDGHMLLIFLRVGQLGAVIMILVCLIVITRRYAKEKKGGAAVLLTWLAFLACVAAGVLMEFALDGRMVTGDLTKLHLYGILALICIASAALPLGLLRGLKAADPE